MDEQKEIKPIIVKPGFKLTWWSWLIIIIAVVAVLGGLTAKYLITDKTGTEITTKPDTKEEITIKQYLSSLRGDLVRYYDSNKTYEGWTPHVTAIEDVKKVGSEIKTKSMTKDTYMVYAEMPETKTIFCLDHTNFTGEVKSISKISNTCQ